MPIQEIVVHQAADLAAPQGVSFGPPCTTKDEDIAAWAAIGPAMTQELANGRYIIVLVQTRSTRPWSHNQSQYIFKPSEDYIVASYSVSQEIGRPYSPSIVTFRWLDKLKADSDKRTMRLDGDMIHMFQCSPKGCNLTSVGLLTLTKMNMKSGKPEVEALSFAKNAIGDAQKFGWRGGSFPGLERAPGENRARSSAFSAPRPRLPGVMGSHRT